MDWSVLEAGRERAVAPSVVMIKGGIRDNPATGGTRACHRPDPAVVAEAAPAAAPEAEVEVAADADNRPGIAQPLLNGGNNHGTGNQS